MDCEQNGVLVTGANGWIGREVCRSLKAQGCFVVACDLEEQAGEWDRFIRIDLNEDPIASISESKEVIEEASEWSLIHCAGYAHRPIETPEEVERFYAINEGGTKKTINWCRQLGVMRIVYISSIAFYDWDADSGEVALKEEAKLSGATAYADSKLKGELCVRESGLDFRVVRLATVFGEGDRANFAKLAKALKARKFILPGAGDARKSVISVKRAAEWIGQLALMPNPAHRLINLGFSEAPTLGEICEAYTNECDFSQAFKAPLWFLRLAALAGDVLAKIKPNFPLTSVNVSKLTRSSCVDCSRAAEVFPELSKVRFADELRNSAEYYRGL
ncbi:MULTISPECIES: NAD(P)-dependent oxidoreductase [unclassified Lentimonas]|uniref:NAD-dependent epimerase/dehydratase family protein n=1 Tax=unclassified Lentimonas TaxID=2630993 RepID=UPI001389A927|nr:MULTISPECIES: NAD(P)-dependent oxidoreductase [unclassified Lentimonas]